MDPATSSTLELPPAYTAPSVVSLPEYSVTHAANERTLAIQPVDVDRTSVPLDYEYSTKHMSLQLGRRTYGTSAPSYGRNSVIHAVVTVTNFKHAKEVSLTIWGKAILTVSDRGYPILHAVRVVLYHSVVLWSVNSGVPRPTTPQRYDVSYPLPTYARSRGSLLPPTMSCSFRSLDVDVRYHVKIDMVRQGFHRHECTNTGFYYLPRSIPTSLSTVTAAFEEVEAKSEAEEEIRWKIADVMPLTGGCGAIVQFGLPLPLSYTAGVPIPFRINIISPAQLSPEDIRPNIQVKLIKVIAVTINKQRVRLDRLLGKGMIWNIESGEGSGVWEVTGSVKGGREGGEVSWSIGDFAEIRYAVKVVIKSIAGLADYEHEESVQMVTNEAQDFELDEARERPALGLINLGHYAL